jgi:hypothetical protein
MLMSSQLFSIHASLRCFLLLVSRCLYQCQPSRLSYTLKDHVKLQSLYKPSKSPAASSSSMSPSWISLANSRSRSRAS